MRLNQKVAKKMLGKFGKRDPRKQREEDVDHKGSWVTPSPRPLKQLCIPALHPSKWILAEMMILRDETVTSKSLAFCKEMRELARADSPVDVFECWDQAYRKLLLLQAWENSWTDGPNAIEDDMKMKPFRRSIAPC